MAILRIKAYYDTKGVANANKYSADRTKTTINDTKTDMERAFGYSSNLDKTTLDDGEVLVSGYLCKPDIAAQQFEATRQLYYANGHQERLGERKTKKIMRAKLDDSGKPIIDANGDMIYDAKSPVYHDQDGKCVYVQIDQTAKARAGYMWVQSFPPPEVCGYNIDPRVVHQIGMEFAQQIGGGDYPCTISTHVNKAHIHNHIIQDAYNISGTHKYIDNMDTLNIARKINDRLSLEYGLPIILSTEQEKAKSLSWKEWDAKKAGESFKEQMRIDITEIMSQSDDYKSFVKNLKMSGYGVRETENHITYISPDNIHRCRDDKLGTDFTKNAIKNKYEQQIQKMAEEQKERESYLVNPNKPLPHHKKLYVSRYVNGRRRSDLEVIILAAIAIIKQIADRFASDKKIEGNEIYGSAAYKIKKLEELIGAVEKHTIQNKQDLENQYRMAGAEIANIGREIKELSLESDNYKEIKAIIDRVREMTPDIQRLGISNVYVHPYTSKDIAHNIADKCPMTPSQRRDLYIATMDNPAYRINCKYNDISYIDANRAINFLTGKTKDRPDIVTDYFTQKNDRITKKYKAIADKVIADMQTKGLDKKPTKLQIQKIEEICNGSAIGIDTDRVSQYQNLSVDTDQLSYYDAQRMIDYFTKPDVISPKATQMELDKMDIMVSQYNLKINKPIYAVTQQDVKDVQDYLNKKQTGVIPTILKDSPQIEKSRVVQIAELMESKGMTPEIPIDQISKAEGNKIYYSLLLHDIAPECIDNGTSTVYSQDHDFDEMLHEYEPDDQETICEYRDDLNKLASVGINLDDINTVAQSIDDITRQVMQLQLQMDDKKQQYKELSQIRHQIGLLENKQYVYGPMYDGSEVVKVKIEEQEQEHNKDKDRDKDKEMER